MIARAQNQRSKKNTFFCIPLMVAQNAKFCSEKRRNGAFVADLPETRAATRMHTLIHALEIQAAPPCAYHQPIPKPFLNTKYPPKIIGGTFMNRKNRRKKTAGYKRKEGVSFFTLTGFI
jgi:hypothetical protein